MAKLVKKHRKKEPEYLPNTRRIGALAQDRKAIDVRAYAVGELTSLADSFVMCSAGSEPHSKAILSSVKEGMKEIGVAPLRMEGKPDQGWLVLDYGDVVFHIFREEAREFYDLDGLWADAPAIDLEVDD